MLTFQWWTQAIEQLSSPSFERCYRRGVSWGFHGIKAGLGWGRSHWKVTSKPSAKNEWGVHTWIWVFGWRLQSWGSEISSKPVAKFSLGTCITNFLPWIEWRCEYSIHFYPKPFNIFSKPYNSGKGSTWNISLHSPHNFNPGSSLTHYSLNPEHIYFHRVSNVKQTNKQTKN